MSVTAKAVSLVVFYFTMQEKLKAKVSFDCKVLDTFKAMKDIYSMRKIRKPHLKFIFASIARR
jgi:hypothetical protein